MKANEAPEKIYVYIPDDDIVGTASTQKGIPHQFVNTEYTRTDAFIKKACDWLESVNLDFYQIKEGVFSKQLVEDFKKYMEEE